MTSRGFTLIELVVSIAIFAFMTALVVSKYSGFNQNTLVTNMAYDTALAIRTAQSYGLSVKSVDSTTNFNAAYGIDFDNSKPTQFIFFTDGTDGTINGFYDGVDAPISTYNLTGGASITNICLGSDASTCTPIGSTDKLDITYRRPNPEAIFYCSGQCIDLPSGSIPLPAAFITVSSADGSNNQIVVIRRNGQISVGN